MDHRLEYLVGHPNLNEWEAEFVESLADWENDITDAQEDKLDEIFEQKWNHDRFLEKMAKDD